MKSFDEYFDKDGLLTFLPDFDGSASAHLHAMYRFGQAIKYRNNKFRFPREQAKYNQELDALEDLDDESREYTGMGPGNYKIHPTDGRYNNPKLFPSIYHRSTVIAMGSLKLNDRLKNIFKAQIKRWGKYQNGKLITHTGIGEYIRAFHMAGYKSMILLWPILLITDLINLCSLTIDDNTCMRSLQAKLSLPTPFSSIVGSLCKTHCMYLENKDDTIPPLKEQYDPIMKEML